MTLNSINLRVDGKLGDQIIRAWLRQHIEWAKDSYDHATNEEDKGDSSSDIIAMQRILNYIGEHDD